MDLGSVLAAALADRGVAVERGTAIGDAANLGWKLAFAGSGPGGA
jgi:hypothetical protein